MENIVIHWYRRDLRLQDNVGLYHALSSGKKVLPIFVFDSEILSELDKDDARVSFIHRTLEQMDQELRKRGSGMQCYVGKPVDIWKEILTKYTVSEVYTNRDYEPYAIHRDKEIGDLLSNHGVAFRTFQDHVIFEKDDVLKKDGTPYTVYTPYKNKWLEKFETINCAPIEVRLDNLYPVEQSFISMEEVGFEKSAIEVKPYTLAQVDSYEDLRNLPAKDGTSYLSPHLRFGTVSVRQIIDNISKTRNLVFLQELIWREFFIQIMAHFPRVLTENFKTKYDHVQWRNDEADFEKWCSGNTGYPMVDAGMRELNTTGYMHNRVRMVVASFLCKHLLIDWRWGEAYFAQKLLDYEAASNNGNWQWSAGTGCDSAPYFRVFNPHEQLRKFDGEMKYVRKWVPEYFGFGYVQPMVEHKAARERALATYKAGLENAKI